MKPSFLIAVLEQALPGFRAYVESDENYYDRDNIHGVFLACSDFVRERPVAARSWEALAAVLNDSVGSPDEELNEAACTCFLENLADPSHPLKVWLRGGALEYWNQWE